MVQVEKQKENVKVFMKKMLNIGCGHRYHKDWVNIDVDPAGPEDESGYYQGPTL